jgi:hypothetical protein
MGNCIKAYTETFRFILKTLTQTEQRRTTVTEYKIVKFDGVYTTTMSDILINSVLTDAVITLAHAFHEAGVNPPKKIEVDSSTFDKLLSESMMLYNIDSKKAISEREFRLSDILLISERSSTSSD